MHIQTYTNIPYTANNDIVHSDNHDNSDQTLVKSTRAHQTRRSARNALPISAEVALPRLQSEIKVALFLFASHPFLANYLRFMVKLIDKAIVINVKIHKNERKGFYSSNKEGLIC